MIQFKKSNIFVDILRTLDGNSWLMYLIQKKRYLFSSAKQFQGKLQWNVQVFKRKVLKKIFARYTFFFFTKRFTTYFSIHIPSFIKLGTTNYFLHAFKVGIFNEFYTELKKGQFVEHFVWIRHFLISSTAIKALATLFSEWNN